ncbi:hypothetical protein MP228_008945 [Amoeboaphelidium protococcarum]|nr:hypothetical protein MP228_008945 [Amoeboaphelidium protococcarum]
MDQLRTLVNESGAVLVTDSKQWQDVTQRLLELSRIESENTRSFDISTFDLMFNCIAASELSLQSRIQLFKSCINIIMLNAGVRHQVNASILGKCCNFVAMDGFTFLSLRFMFVLTAHRPDLCSPAALSLIHAPVFKLVQNIQQIDEDTLNQIFKLIFNFKARLSSLDVHDILQDYQLVAFKCLQILTVKHSDQISLYLDGGHLQKSDQNINVANSFNTALQLLVNYDQEYSYTRFSSTEMIDTFDENSLCQVSTLVACISLQMLYNNSGLDQEHLQIYLMYLIQLCDNENVRQQLKMKLLPHNMDRSRPLNEGSAVHCQLIKSLMSVELSSQNKELLFRFLHSVCGKDVGRSIFYCGFGPWYYFLFQHGLFSGNGNDQGDGVMDLLSNSLADDGTKIADIVLQQNVDIMTGAIKQQRIVEMTDDEKDQEASKIMTMIERLNKTGIIQMQFGQK